MAAKQYAYFLGGQKKLPTRFLYTQFGIFFLRFLWEADYADKRFTFTS